MKYIYKLISFLINIFSYLFIFIKPKYDFIVIQKFSDQLTVNTKDICNKLINDGYEVKVVYSTTNNFINIIRDIFYTQFGNIIVIDSFSLGISNVKRFKQKKIIQIWHALGAIKKFGYQSLDTKNGRSSIQAKYLRMHKNNYSIIATSESTKKIYEKAFNNKRVEVYKLPEMNYSVNKVNIGKRSILYLPTYRENSMFGVKELIDNIDHNIYDFNFKLHKNDEVNTEYSQYQTNANVFFLLQECDILITDYSAACFSAAINKTPIIFYWHDKDEYIKDRGLNLDDKYLKNVCYDVSTVIKSLHGLDKSDYLVKDYLNAKDDVCDYLIDLIKK